MILVDIQEHDFNVGEEYQRLVEANPNAGAVVFFVGLVRGLYPQSNSDKEPAVEEHIERIELSHYSGMTEKLCQQIAQQANQRFPFDSARIVHRVGALKAGEQIVFVAIASRHRDNAFQAGEFIMDYLKNQAPLWKKEVGSRGEHWLGVKKSDAEALSKWQHESNCQPTRKNER